MTLVYLGATNVPNYTALSSDIDGDNKIPGASRKGNTVFTTDNGNWYIINESLVLNNYTLPVGIGDVAIGEVSQGTASSTERWLIKDTPPNTSIVLGALDGTTTIATTDITGATVPANKVFVGSISMSMSVGNPVNTAKGTIHMDVTWVPGTGGTTSRKVCSLNIALPNTANQPSNTGVSDSSTVSPFPVMVYAGTTSGKFVLNVTSTGTITDIVWDVSLNGSAQ